MKNLKYLVFGALTYVLVILLFSNYGNVYSHREINQLAITKFQDNITRSAFPLEKFKNYIFVFYGSHKYKGNFVSEGGLTIIEEISEKLNPGQWIVHGGYSADEPEIYASFRHFYDPTTPRYDHYLHNMLDDIDHQGVIENPRIDHIEWATDHPEHTYNWENGKIAIIRALQHKDEDIKETEMAFAWRALGETLHMIADMGCPAHVRDDAHAAESFTGWKLGSPDPYEEFMVDIARNEGLKNLHDAGKVDLKLKSQFTKAKTLEEIAIPLAEYTNKNFFTTQTISGSDVKPIIHTSSYYDSPKLDDCEYDPLEFNYTKNISGNEVIMCRDLKYKLLIFKKRGYPYIDKKATYSQAKALLPQIVEAGANTMRLFIPQLKVEILEYDSKEKTLKGRVKHTTDEEYGKEIKYNGKLTIYDGKTKKTLVDVECKNGEFEEEVKPSKFNKVDWKKEGIFADIQFGGIVIKSEPFKAEIETNTDLSKYTKVELDYFGYDKVIDKWGEVYQYGDLSLFPLQIGGRALNLTWSGTSFSSDTTYTTGGTGMMQDRYETTHEVVTGEVSKDLEKLIKMTWIISLIDENQSIDFTYATINSTITVENLPANRICFDKILCEFKGSGTETGSFITNIEYNKSDHYFYQETNWTENSFITVRFGPSD